MKKIIAIQSDDLKKINPITDTSLQLAIEAQNRGYKIFFLLHFFIISYVLSKFP